MKFGEENSPSFQYLMGERKADKIPFRIFRRRSTAFLMKQNLPVSNMSFCILCGNSKPLRTMNIIALKLRIICKAKAIASENWGNRMYRGESQLPISFR